MLEEIWKKHNLIYDNFDLGSPFTLLITIQGDRAIITNSNEDVWATNISKENIGVAIAETMMLKGLSANGVEYGSFTANKSLPTLDSILKMKEEDFYFDTNYLKIWTLLRVICNSDFGNKIVEVSFDTDSDYLYYEIFTEEEYKKDYEETAKFYEE